MQTQCADCRRFSWSELGLQFLCDLQLTDRIGQMPVCLLLSFVYSIAHLINS